jgi:exonuclease SbcC
MTSGRERTFKQLSGGEQMAAALAVRLALLREVSAVDIAFFDEPTANLDDHRRDNLAEQILRFKGFSQLFVISHDDTFERDTDNVVRVVKENGVSRACPEPFVLRPKD